MIFQSRYGQGYGKGRLLCWSPALTSSRRDRRSRVRRPWNHQGIGFPPFWGDQRAGLASSNSSNHSPEMWVYRILILLIPIVCDTHDSHCLASAGRSSGRRGARIKGRRSAGALSGEDRSEVMGAQDFVSFGYGSQSRETMEVGYSAKSECYGAFERRRETSTMEEFNKKMDQKMDQILQAIGMWVNQNQPDADRSTTGGMLMNENQSSTVVRVKLEREEKAAVIIQALCGLPWCG